MRPALLFIALLILCVIEASFLPGLTGGVFFPSLLLALSLALALTNRSGSAYIIALSGGTILELLGPAFPGSHVLPLVASIAATRALQTRAFSHRSTVSLILLSFLGSLIAAATSVTMAATTGLTPDLSRPALLAFSLSIIGSALLTLGTVALTTSFTRLLQRSFLRTSHGAS